VTGEELSDEGGVASTFRVLEVAADPFEVGLEDLKLEDAHRLTESTRRIGYPDEVPRAHVTRDDFAEISAIWGYGIQEALSVKCGGIDVPKPRVRQERFHTQLLGFRQKRGVIV
jgi:hypothetical protein